MNTPAQEATDSKRPRKQPQPRNFKEFIILFSDGTFILADASDVIEKSKQAKEETLKAEHLGKLSFEIRGLSHKIMEVYRKSVRSDRVSVMDGAVTIDNADSKDGTLTIKYEE